MGAYEGETVDSVEEAMNPEGWVRPPANSSVVGDGRSGEAINTRLLGPVVGPFCQSVADHRQVPLEAVVTTALGVLGGVLQGKARVGVGGWNEQLAIWGVTVLNSGERKSPLVNDVVGPMREAERDQRDAEREELQVAQALYAAAQKRLKVCENNMANAKGEMVATAQLELEAAAREFANMFEPHGTKWFVDDITPEALGTALSRHRSLIMATDEGGVFETMVPTKGERAGRVDVWIHSHSGAANSTARVSREEEERDRAFLSVAITTQPGPIQAALSNARLEDRGMVGRFLVSYPTSKVGHRVIRPERPDPMHARRWADLVKSLSRLSMPEAGEHIPVIPYSTEAADAWDRVCDQIEKDRRPDSNSELLACGGAWAGKYDGHVARLAGIIHACQHGDKLLQEPMTKDTISAAAQLGAVYLRHMASLSGYAQDVTDNQPAREKVVRWIKQLTLDEQKAAGNEEPVAIGMTQLFRRCGGGFVPYRLVMDEMVELLADQGLVRVWESRGGNGQVQWNLVASPYLLEG